MVPDQVMTRSCYTSVGTDNLDPIYRRLWRPVHSWGCSVHQQRVTLVCTLLSTNTRAENVHLNAKLFPWLWDERRLHVIHGFRQKLLCPVLRLREPSEEKTVDHSCDLVSFCWPQQHMSHNMEPVTSEVIHILIHIWLHSAKLLVSLLFFDVGSSLSSTM